MRCSTLTLLFAIFGTFCILQVTSDPVKNEKTASELKAPGEGGQSLLIRRVRQALIKSGHGRQVKEETSICLGSCLTDKDCNGTPFEGVIGNPKGKEGADAKVGAFVNCRCMELKCQLVY